MADLIVQIEGGDADAAYSLFRALRACSHIPVDRPELDVLVAEIRSTATYDGIYYGSKSESLIRRLYGWFDYCDGVPIDSRDGYFQWLEVAADGGSIEAQLDFANVIPPGDLNSETVRAFREKATQHLLEAANQGSVEALEWLAMAYEGGVMTDKDLVAAYGYAYAAAMAHAQADSTRAGAVKSLADSLERRISAYQIDEARIHAAQLLSNPNCCTFQAR